MRNELHQMYELKPSDITESDVISDSIEAVEADVLLILRSLPRRDAMQMFDAFIDEQIDKLDHAALTASILDESDRLGIRPGNMLPLLCSTFEQQLKAEFARRLAASESITDGPPPEAHKQYLTKLLVELAELVWIIGDEETL